jgi:carboxylesterase
MDTRMQVSTALHPGERHPVRAGAEARSWSGSSSAGVLVLHGFTGTPRSMLGVAEALAAAGLTVELPRLPGHGTDITDMLATDWHDWVGEALRAHDALAGRVANVAVVGLSMGATLTAAVAVERPSVAGVAVINGALEPLGPEIVDGVRALLAAGERVLDSPGSDVARQDGPRDPSYEATPLGPLLSLAEEGARLAARLEEIRCPSLVMCAPQDHVVSPTASRHYADRVSGPVEWVDLPNSYHVATLDHDAPLIEERVVAFVRRVLGH